MSLDVIAIGKAKNYTDDSIEGYSDVIKGKNCVVSSTVIEGGHRVTVGWYRDSDDAYQEFYFDVMDGVDGADGKDGKDGVDGVQPVLSIGTVTKGTTASATITGTAADPKLNLVLPQGDTGVGIVSIAKTDTSGITDTYTVTYDNDNTDTFTVTNGDSVVSASVDELNNLSFTMASGNDINAGQIQLKGQQGYFPCGAELIWNGTTAPQGFLMCDGSEYLKTAYPQLAAFLAATDTAQGTTYFAGSDSAHFKVPDAKGEYYRGAGTNSHTGQGNGGNVGEHQDATVIPNVGAAGNNNNPRIIATTIDPTNYVQNEDTALKNENAKTFQCIKTGDAWSGSNDILKYTVRPTSTSKNNIIAYQDIYLAPRHQYSTEEHVVGTWIDRRPVYERILTLNPLPVNNTVLLTDVSEIIDQKGHLNWHDSTGDYQLEFPFSEYSSGNTRNCAVRLNNNSEAYMFCVNVPSQIISAYITIQYTKTTDIVS